MNIRSIEYMKIYRNQLDFPYPANKKESNEIVFLYSNNVSEIHSMYNHPILKRRARYITYYIDDMYQGTLYNRKYRVRKITERKEYYQTLKKSIPGLRVPLKINDNLKANMFVDLLWYNEIFYDRLNTIPVFKRSTEFLLFYKKIFEDAKFNNFKKSVFINASEWKFTKARVMDDPLCIIYNMLLLSLSDFKRFGDIDIIFYTDTMMFKINPTKVYERSFSQFALLLAKLNSSYKELVPENDETRYVSLMRNEEKKVNAINNIIDKTTKNFTGDDEVDNVDNEGINKAELSKIMNDANIKDIGDNESEESIEDKIIQDINSDKETLTKIYNKITGDSTIKSKASMLRDEKIREEHKKIKIDNMSLEDVIKTASDVSAPKIHTTDVSDKVNTINANVSEIKFRNIAKTYNEKLYIPDTVAAFDALSKTEVPLYIRDIQVEDGSDKFNYVDTWTVHFEDINRNRHTVKVDMPKFIDDHYLYLGGGYKQILNQEYFKPIVKIKEDEVQLVSSYNKIFVRREGTKINPEVEKFKKFFAEDRKGFVIVRGNTSLNNKGFNTSLEYDDLSKLFQSITYKYNIDHRKETVEIIFNQKEIYTRLNEKHKRHMLEHNLFCIGFLGKDPFFSSLDPDDENSAINSTIRHIINAIPELNKEFPSIKSGKKFMWSSATLMAKKVPLIILLGFFEGLSTVLKKANIPIQFSDKKPDSWRKSYIQFSDGYLFYDVSNVHTGLLLNSLQTVNTKDYLFEDFNDRAVYINLLENVYGERNIVLALCNYYNSMVDPIMESICRRLNYPTDLVGLLLHCNKLLSDNTFTKDINMNVYRIRCNEVVPAILYKELSKAYSKFYATSSNKKPVKVSMNRRAVINNLLSQKTVEDVSFINPTFVSDRVRTVSPKGFTGTNLDEAYKLPQRSYDPTMLGIIGLSTPSDGNTGKIRYMSVSPNIVDARGFMDIKDINNKKDMDSLKDCNMMTAAEMVTFGAARMDDSTRTAMMSKQSGHLIPTQETSPLLVTNGFDQTIQYQLPSQYAIIAEEDGEIVEIRSDIGLIFIKYKSGKVRAIDISTRIDKNGGGGFHLANRLLMNCELKVGQKVKKNDILAHDSKFFKNDLFGNRMCVGTLCKAAIYSSYSTLEDSTRMTQSAAEKMASFITKEEAVVIDKNATVEKIVNVGDTIEVGQELITFEPGFDEDVFNEMLVNVGAKFGEEIKNIGKVKKESHYQGTIVDIQIYCGSDVDDLSPSLQKIVKKYYAKIKSIEKALDKYDSNKSVMKCGMIFNKSCDTIDTSVTHGKIKGFDVNDGVLILFYIEYKDIMSIGDKIANYSAIKATIGEIIPTSQEPRGIFRPTESIDIFLPSSSCLKRMSSSAPMIGFMNKVLIELKRKLADMYYDRQYPSDNLYNVKPSPNTSKD